MVEKMARLARVVVPGYPHHITQRGNRRQQVFFRESDYSNYLELLREWCGHEGLYTGRTSATHCEIKSYL
jgi:putative transposase